MDPIILLDRTNLRGPYAFDDPSGSDETGRVGNTPEQAKLTPFLTRDAGKHAIEREVALRPKRFAIDPVGAEAAFTFMRMGYGSMLAVRAPLDAFSLGVETPAKLVYCTAVYSGRPLSIVMDQSLPPGVVELRRGAAPATVPATPAPEPSPLEPPQPAPAGRRRPLRPPGPR